MCVYVCVCVCMWVCVHACMCVTCMFADVCYYNGQKHQEGRKWRVGCDTECICEDGIYGYYRCYSRYLLPHCF